MSLTYAYAGPLVKQEKTPEGDLLVYGKATGPDLDLDEQVCDPKWLQSAMPKWAEWANVREQHTAIAAGVGVETVQDGDDWFVKALVTDKGSAHKVETGTLKGYSVGIRNARVVKDADAPGGRIVGGEIVEISLVDRPCNPTAKLAIAKAAKGGGDLQPVDAPPAPAAPAATGPGFDMGEDVLPGGMTVKAVMLGTIDDPAGALVKDSNTANAGKPPKTPKGKRQKEKMNRYGALPSQAATGGDGGDPNAVTASASGPLASASPFGAVQPMQNTKAAQPDTGKRDFTADQRRQMAANGTAMPDGSFPIETAGDLDDAIGLAGNANNPAKARKFIKRRAAALGLSDRIPDSWKVAKPHSNKAAGTNQVTSEAINKAVAEATKALEAELATLRAQLAKVAATPIPGGPHLITQGATPPPVQATVAKAAEYRAVAQATSDPSIAAAYIARAKQLESAPA